MRRLHANSEAAIAVIAARQHGIVSVHQLAAAGLDEAAVRRRVRAARLHRLYRGIYAVGHLGIGREGRWMAAVLACGPNAALSHGSAAELWGLLPAEVGPVHVTVPTSGGRPKRRGIRIHRSRTLTPEVVTRRLGIPLTSPARTLSDLRRSAPAAESRRAARQAEFLGLHLGADREPDRTRSELEHAFLKLVRRHRLPAPQVNAAVGPFTVDFLWPERRLIVETDGYRHHRGRQAFEDDRARDLKLRLLGYHVLRLSYVQVVEEPRAVAEALRTLL